MEEEIRTSNALVPFSHTSPYADVLQAESRLFTFFERNIVMKQQWEEGGHGGTSIGFGASVYNCAIVLAFYIESIAIKFLGKRVIELGCGPGLCSIVAGLTGARDVIATDGDMKSVELTSLNILENNVSSSVKAMKLFWGDEADLSRVQSSWSDARSGRATVDFIIASDVAGCPYVSAYTSLIDTLLALSGPETVILMACQKRHSSENCFYDMLREKFNVERLPRSTIHHDFKQLPIFMIKATLPAAKL